LDTLPGITIRDLDQTGEGDVDVQDMLIVTMQLNGLAIK
jgi:hypothetical protein